nr:MAG TPA: hypothetical protein [Caudoviricetes sp.]
MSFYPFYDFGAFLKAYSLNALNSISFLAKYFYIFIIWNIFAK